MNAPTMTKLASLFPLFSIAFFASSISFCCEKLIGGGASSSPESMSSSSSLEGATNSIELDMLIMPNVPSIVRFPEGESERGGEGLEGRDDRGEAFADTGAENDESPVGFPPREVILLLGWEALPLLTGLFFIAALA